MGKDKNPRRVADNEAMAKTRMLRTSPPSPLSTEERAALDRLLKE